MGSLLFDVVYCHKIDFWPGEKNQFVVTHYYCDRPKPVNTSEKKENKQIRKKMIAFKKIK